MRAGEFVVDLTRKVRGRYCRAKLGGIFSRSMSFKSAGDSDSLKEGTTVGRSWVDGTLYDKKDADSLKCRFDQQGFLHVRAFASKDEVESMLGRMNKLVKGWTPGEEKLSAFRTDEKQETCQGSNDYFLDSADRIHFFAEPGAVDKDGVLMKGVSKDRSLNKVGHGLHIADDVFHEYSHSEKVRKLVKRLGWIDPVLPQSMYIFKQPGIGGEVTSHQDSTFLFTTPRQTCLGLWLALHDATLENGCLWVRPGSHRESLRRQFVRNPNHFEKKDIDAAQMMFENRADSDEAGKAGAWEGKLPEGSWPPPSEGLRKVGFVPVECKAGDLVCFPGTLDHLSLPNVSKKPRHTYQLHLIEGPGAGVTWSPRNWLQTGKGKTFASLKL